MTEDEMIGCYHRLDGLESEQAPGDGEGQGSLACCSPWGHKESNTIQRLNNEQQLHQLESKFEEGREVLLPTNVSPRTKTLPGTQCELNRYLLRKGHIKVNEFTRECFQSCFTNFHKSEFSQSRH